MPFPVIGAAIGGISIAIARYLVPYIIAKSVIALGLTLLTFIGVDALSDYIVNTVRSQASGLGSDFISIMALAGFFDAMEVILAAWVAAISIRSIRGSFRKLSFISAGS